MEKDILSGPAFSAGYSGESKSSAQSVIGGGDIIVIKEKIKLGGGVSPFHIIGQYEHITVISIKLLQTIDLK